jgi:hypothetical protein
VVPDKRQRGKGANEQQELVSSGGGSAVDAVQQELSGLRIVFEDDQSQAEEEEGGAGAGAGAGDGEVVVPGSEIFVADQLWPGMIMFTQQLYPSWAGLDMEVLV